MSLSRPLTVFFALARHFATFIRVPLDRRSAIAFNGIVFSRRNRTAIFIFS